MQDLAKKPRLAFRFERRAVQYEGPYATDTVIWRFDAAAL
jgi:hypothetical protein